MKFPKHIIKQANEVLALLEQNKVKPRLTKKHRYLVLEVGRRYRLVNRGLEWELMSHETYNKKIDK